MGLKILQKQFLATESNLQILFFKNVTSSGVKE